MNKKKFSPGQAIFEFVLILPIILLLIMGTFDLARAFSTKIVLANAAREGAYYLANHSDDKDNCDSFCYANTVQVIQNEASNSGINIAPADITISGCCTKGDSIQVTVDHQITITIYSLFYGPLQISGSEFMVVLK
jgi:Flp pilus assembly protein TadG